MKDFRKTTPSQKINKMMELADREVGKIMKLLDGLLDNGELYYFQAISNVDFKNNANNMIKVSVPKDYRGYTLEMIVELYQYYLKLRAGSLKEAWKYYQTMQHFNLVLDDLILTAELAKENWKPKRNPKPKK